VTPQPRFLDRVVRLARRAEHPIRDGVQMSAVRLEVAIHCYLPGSPSVSPADMTLTSVTRAEVTGRTDGGLRTIVQEIIRNEPPRAWAARGVDGPIRPHATITVEPVGAGSTVIFSLDFDGHGVGIPLAPLVRRQAEKAAPTSYRNLKRLPESGVGRS
jgi:Polyketide cyclase / dehydrase and lipid transport